MKYTHVIWDFNGTLLDDVEICVQSINVLLEERGLPILSDLGAYREVSGFPIVDYYKRLGFDFSKEPYDVIALEWVDQYLRRVDRAIVYDGVEDMLSYVRQKHLGQVLLSATELDMLVGQVKSIGVGHFFDEICGMDNVYAHGKQALAQRWREQHPDAAVLLVGDTDHDYEVACAMEGDCLLFSGGHQSRARLEKLGCPVIDHLRELKNFL